MLHVYRPVLEVLMQRGVQDPYTFLRPSRWADLPAPSTIEGIAEAVPFLLRAVKAGLKITIFGDYDCDGALSSAILEATLLRLGAMVDVYLPHRDEGYGLSESAVHRFSRSGTKILITIDNGINAAGPVHLAQRLGMRVVVIDHHQIETRADTQAVWSDEFCAAGLAYMVSSALLQQSNLAVELRDPFLASLSRLAAIASIADCVPLAGATRTLTRLGLAELSRTTHAGLRKLMDLGGIMRARVPSAEEVAFRIGPRLNAAGRVGHPVEVLRMLKARTPEEQSRLALELDRLNLLRRRLEKEALEELTGLVDTQGESVLVVYAAHWRKGLAGILASRARERFGVPTFVLVHDPKTGMAVGSGRSVEGISLIDALRSCKGVLHRYGGHRQAAGVTVAVEAVPAFRNALRQYVAEHPAPLEIAPMPSVDLELCAATPSFCEQLRAMEPFGVGNPVPVFRVHAASIHPRTEKFVTVRQGSHELKARASGILEKQEPGTALLALNGSSATLVQFVPKARKHNDLT